MKAEARQRRVAVLLVAAALGFAYSVFVVINKREQLRTAERHKHQAREAQIRLDDEWRNLQLEYATLTSYRQLHGEAQRLGMRMPRLAQDTFYYLPQPQEETQ